MNFRYYVRDRLGYIIIVGLLVFIIMYTTIKVGNYPLSIILCLLLFIVILFLINSELKRELLKEIEGQDLIKEQEGEQEVENPLLKE